MTARPIFSESRRKKASVAVALCIVMVAVLLAVGCMSQSVEKNSSENLYQNITATVPETSPTQMPTTFIAVPTVCLVPLNGSYWLKIDPMKNVKRGDPIYVNGTTNIPVGKKLLVTIHEDNWAGPFSFYPIIQVWTKIIPTSNCINRFSQRFNSTDFVVNYNVTVLVETGEPPNYSTKSQVIRITNETDSARSP